METIGSTNITSFYWNVVNYLIHLGFRLFLNATLHSCFPPLPSISYKQVHSSSFSESLIGDPKVVLDFFLGGEVTGLGLNPSLGVGDFVRIFR
jgi:hypothetical protein